jgi:hypothetical protein
MSRALADELARRGRMSAQVLIATLDEAGSSRQAFAVEYVGWCGRDAAAALPRLEGLRHHPDPGIASSATESIERITWAMSR